MIQSAQSRYLIGGRPVIGVILAGGAGKRLNGISDPAKNGSARPKPLVDVLTGRAIDYSIDAFSRLGLKQVIISANSSSESQIMNCLSSESREPIIELASWSESHPLGTARAFDFVVQSVLKKLDSNGENITFLVQGADTPHNLDLRPLLNDHLENVNDVTVGVVRRLPHQLEREAGHRTFATVVTDGFAFSGPENSAEDRERLDSFYQSQIGKSKPITYFSEQTEGNLYDSAFISTFTFAVNAEFWRTIISPLIKPDNSDFGFDIFPAMASLENPDGILNKQSQEIARAMRGRNFNAYFFPQDRFWCDVGTPYLLWQANMQGLKGRIGDLSRFGKTWQETALGLIGADTRIDESTLRKAKKASKKSPGPTQLPRNIIGCDCSINRNVFMRNSVIGDHVQINGGVKLDGVVVLSCTPEYPTIISQADLKDSIVAGGSIPGKQITGTLIANGAVVYRGPGGELIVAKMMP